MTTVRTPDDEPDAQPGTFLPPFREGWTYQGATYAGHSDYATDWNRRTPSGGWLDDTGDPVLAAADGHVAEVDKRDGLVMLNHWNDSYRTEYRHMTDIKVKVGDRVQRGDRIGSIGNVAGDGRSFGSHLHHVHYRRVGGAWKRVQMSFEGKPIATSVGDSDTRPEGWKAPDPVYVQGPPPKATWEGAYREAAKALAKATERLDAAKAQTALATEERDAARAQYASAMDALARANADLDACRAVTPVDCADETYRALAAEQKVADALAVLTR